MGVVKGSWVCVGRMGGVGVVESEGECQEECRRESQGSGARRERECQGSGKDLVIPTAWRTSRSSHSLMQIGRKEAMINVLTDDTRTHCRHQRACFGGADQSPGSDCHCEGRG